jgi:hydroxyacid-oxoacid transhydrogenase
VSLTAPEAFRFTFEARPERHLHAAELLAPGLDRPGYDEGDVGDLVEGTMKQQRLLDTAPRPVTEDDAAAILSRSLENW